MSETTATTMRCVIVTPEETVLDTEADFVAVPLFDGEAGIARQHSAMIGRLGFGELRISKGAETSRYYVDGGFVQVVDDVVSVLTNRSLEAEKVDGAAAQELLEAANHRQAAGEEQIALRERLQAQARGQLHVARLSQ